MLFLAEKVYLLYSSFQTVSTVYLLASSQDFLAEL